MSKPWLNCIACLAAVSVTPAFANEEYVVSAITCSVGDPGELGADLGLKKGNTIIIESLNTKVSTFFIQDEAYVTGFPAALKFSDDRFLFEGTEIWDDTHHLSLRIEGSMQNTKQGYLWFAYQIDTRRRVALADLENCVRRK